MFLFQETYYVRPGLQDAVDKRVRSLHENHATNPAYAAMDWLKYCGDATTYVAFRLWHDQNVTMDAKQLAWMAEYNRTRPADAFLQPPDIEYFTQVEQRQVDQLVSRAADTFMVRSDFHAAGGSNWSALEEELRERLLASEHFGEYRLYRFMGGENRYFRAEFWRDREAAIAFWSQADMREFTVRLGAALRRPPAFGHYDVLHQLGTAKPIPTLKL